MKKILTLSACALVIFTKAQVCFRPAQTTYLMSSVNPYSVCSADLDGDGILDLATTNYTANTVSVLLGIGGGNFMLYLNYPVGSNPQSVTSADFNGDGKTDLAVANHSSNNITVLLGPCTGFTATNYTVGTNPASVTTADFNADGKADLAVADYGLNKVSVLLGTGTGSFGAATSFSVGFSPQSVISADFNGDGKKDLAVANHGSNNLSILLGSGTGSFGTATNFAAGSVPNSITSADFNGDGKTDLAVATTNSNISVLLGTGTGSFGAITTFTAGTNPYSIISTDFNADGNPDLAAANTGSNNVSILLGSGTGTFANAINFGIGGSSSAPYSVTSTDLNIDGKPDLITSNYGSSDVSVLLNGLPISISGTQTICSGDSTTLTVSGATSYTWSANAGGSSSATVTVYPTNNITYSVTGDNGICTSTQSVAINVNQPPTLNATSDSLFLCAGNTTTLTASGANTYTWSTTQTGNNIVISPTVTTTYTVTGTDTNGCVNTTAVTQTVITCSTGLKESSTSNEINLYPNPTNGKFTIEFNSTEKQSIQVHNSNGQLMLNQIILSKADIDVSFLTQGVYSLIIKNNTGIIIKKIVVLK